VALHGDVYVNGEKLFAWEAVWRETEEDRGEDGDEEAVFTHIYDVVIAYPDGLEVRGETRNRPEETAEGLAAKVLLKAAWGQRERAKANGKRRKS
jgi:hypothetical protein